MLVVAEAELLWVPSLGPLFAGAARAEGLSPEAADVTVMIAEAVLGVANGTSRLFLALSDDSVSPSPLVNGQGVAGIVQVDYRGPSLYECRRLYVPPFFRGRRVAWQLLQKAARDLEAAEATIVFSSPAPVKRTYERLGARVRTTVYEVEIGRVRAALRKEQPPWEPRRSLSVSGS